MSPEKRKVAWQGVVEKLQLEAQRWPRRWVRCLSVDLPGSSFFPLPGAEGRIIEEERYVEYVGCCIESLGRVYIVIQNLEAKIALLEIW
jgi:hypothetical protein